MTGWTWEYIDESMDLPRLKAMNGHWKASPPIHIMLAQFFGYERKTQQPVNSQQSNDDEMAALIGILTNVQ